MCSTPRGRTLRGLFPIARCKRKELINSAESAKPSYCMNHKEAMHANTERGKASHFTSNFLKSLGDLVAKRILIQ